MVIREGYYSDGWKYEIYKRGNDYILLNERNKRELRFRKLSSCRRYIDNKNYIIVNELQ